MASPDRLLSDERRTEPIQLLALRCGLPEDARHFLNDFIQRIVATVHPRLNFRKDMKSILHTGARVEQLKNVRRR